MEPEIISLSAGYLEDKQLIDCFNDLLNDLSGEIPWPLSIRTRKGNSMVIRASTDLDSSEAEQGDGIFEPAFMLRGLSAMM